ncbi:MAG: hypothetical protein ACOC8F_03340 [Planctomycetota bacterium]
MRKLAFLCVVAAAVGGCRRPAVTFPEEPVRRNADDVAVAYDTDGNGRADFFCLPGDDGRIDRIGYARNGEPVGTDTSGAAAGPDEIIDLDAIEPDRCRHVVIILDGYRYEVIRAMRRAGHLRMFHRPSRLIAPYPAMTDLALTDLLATAPCRAFEAKYFDRSADRMVGGGGAYLKGRNEPYNRAIDYRAELIWVPIFYLYPRESFRKDLHDAKRAFDASDRKELVAYLSSTAGVGTRLWRDGQIAALEQVERLVLQLLHESRGLTEITLVSDHGHTYTPCTGMDFAGALGERGWRLTDRLTRPRDVVLAQFGVTTFASFYADERAELAADLAGIEGVELTSYAEGDTVVVLAPPEEAGGPPRRAVVRRQAGRFAYRPERGDPLELRDILGQLPGRAGGFHDADALLAATVDHRWPAPLQRLWRAHFGAVENVPEVIASLADDRCVGSPLFRAMIDTASTHGGLNRHNAVTFIMSTAGELPSPLRARDVPAAMGELFGVPRWPRGR